MSRKHKALPDERENYKGPSHERRKRKRLRKISRERELRDRWVTEEYGQRGHGACGRKARFRSMHEAETFATQHHLRRPLWAYRCKYCGGWHLTRHPERGSVPL